MKKLVAHAFFISSLFLVSPFALYASGTGVHPSVQRSQPGHKQPIQLLFVMQANHAEISQTSTGLKLTLSNVNEKTLYFSDRPIRKAGVLSTTQFMANWMKPSSSFKKSPPNAAIIFDELPIDKNGITRAKVIKLENPVTDGNNSWSFKITDLSGKIIPGHYTKVSVFIDSESVPTNLSNAINFTIDTM